MVEQHPGRLWFPIERMMVVLSSQKHTRRALANAGAQETRMSPAKRRSSSRRGKQTRYAEITLAALTGAISATHLCDPADPQSRGSTSGIWSLERALEDLAEGGYVIDLRPLAAHPQLLSWVLRAPLSNGRLEDEQIERLPDEVREAARDLMPWLGGAYQWLAFLAATRSGEPADGSAGPFDGVSAASLAAYWGSRGARIGKRRGNAIDWSDGQRQPLAAPGRPAAPRPRKNREQNSALATPEERDSESCCGDVLS